MKAVDHFPPQVNTMLARTLHQRCASALQLTRPAIARSVFSTSAGVCESEVSIDTSGMSRPEPHSHDKLPGKEEETDMAKHIKIIIRVSFSWVTVRLSCLFGRSS